MSLKTTLKELVLTMVAMSPFALFCASCTVKAVEWQYEQNAIAHLLDYERSVTKGEYCIASLDNAVMGLGWLLSHIVEINDKAVLPSERLALVDGYKALFLHYENEKSI